MTMIAKLCRHDCYIPNDSRETIKTSHFSKLWSDKNESRKQVLSNVYCKNLFSKCKLGECRWKNQSESVKVADNFCGLAGYIETTEKLREVCTYQVFIICRKITIRVIMVWYIFDGRCVWSFKINHFSRNRLGIRIFVSVVREETAIAEK